MHTVGRITCLVRQNMHILEKHGILKGAIKSSYCTYLIGLSNIARNANSLENFIKIRVRL